MTLCVGFRLARNENNIIKKMTSKYQWQGEPVKVIFGFCKMTYNDDKPLFWYNYECSLNKPEGRSAIVPAITVTTEDNYTFAIANHYGIGVHKLLRGGWPNHTHFSLDLDKFEKCREGWCLLTKFEHEDYSEHEAGRRKWQKETNPEEFEKSENLRKMIEKGALFNNSK